LSNGETADDRSFSRRADPWTAAKGSHGKPGLIGADPSFEVLVAPSTMSGCASDRSTAVLDVMPPPQEGMIGPQVSGTRASTIIGAAL
jgi:hypothetical protein